MQRIEGRLVFSATDLTNFLECRRLTELQTFVARGLAVRPEVDDPQAELVRRKGDEHERAYLAALRASGAHVVEIEKTRGAEGLRAAEAATVAAMRDGAQIIYQATFFDGTFLGHADFLRRVERPSALGAWSYEVLDTKLALSTKPYFLIQLCNYAEHLERIQGVMPERGYIVLGAGDTEAFVLADYLAYYRRLKASFLSSVSKAERIDAPDEYPLKRGHCRICPWDDACAQQRRKDDHLSLVAWMRADQVRRFEDAGITTVAKLAAASDDARPFGMNPDTFVKLRRQAAMQMRGRTDGGNHYAIVEHDRSAGFALLPEPNEGDVYFDMEGDPHYEPGRGLEYLFGLWTLDGSFTPFWGLDRASERLAFERCIDYLIERRRAYPAMHVYHYANYEKAALRRLAQTYGTREDEVDELLRGEVLVDLYAVVRQTLVISEDSYSIKRLEKFYGFTRDTKVRRGDDSIVIFEQWLLDRDPALLDAIALYNADDCRSTYELHRWLLARRTEAIALDIADPSFRPIKSGAADAPAADASASELSAALARAADGEAELLAHLVAYHRREEKPAWWAFFDRRENVDQLVEFDRDAIGGLTLRDDIEPRAIARSSVYTYAFPPQAYKLRAGEKPANPATGKSPGQILSIDRTNNVLELKSTMSPDAARGLAALIPNGPPNSKDLRAAIARIGQAFHDGTLDARFPAVADLLHRRAPRARGYGFGTPLQPARVDATSLLSIVSALESSYLFVQGPPGTGKTTTGARVIVALLARGARVGIVSRSHKAVHNMLDCVERTARSAEIIFRGGYKHTNDNPDSAYRSPLSSPLVTSHETAQALDDSGFTLLGGTPYFFAREAMLDRFDYLFIDEAGQLALADALAVSTTAKNVVLLGDPSQLAQVSQGAHPLGAGASILEHVLGDHRTIPPDRGVLLDVSYRMHPDICAYISDLMYEGRLHAGDATMNHQVRSGGYTGSGIRYHPVEHRGNGAESPEEADAIVREIALLRMGTVADDDGIERALTDRDIIVVTPYNAQRGEIERRLVAAGFPDVRVGTVDKFQGQQAAVVFYSMATSDGDTVPRDLDFLFERNRFNVAISRARALAILVCSPRLLEVNAQSPQQMAMINALCAYVERTQPSIAMV